MLCLKTTKTVPQTVSTWFKSKDKLLSSLEKAGSNPKRKKMRGSEFENVDIEPFSSTKSWEKLNPMHLIVDLIIENKVIFQYIYSISFRDFYKVLFLIFLPSVFLPEICNKQGTCMGMAITKIDSLSSENSITFNVNVHAMN